MKLKLFLLLSLLLTESIRAASESPKNLKQAVHYLVTNSDYKTLIIIKEIPDTELLPILPKIPVYYDVEGWIYGNYFNNYTPSKISTHLKRKGIKNKHIQVEIIFRAFKQYLCSNDFDEKY